MSPLETMSIPTSGAAKGFLHMDEAFMWHQADTLGIETLGISRRILAMRPRTRLDEEFERIIFRRLDWWHGGESWRAEPTP